MTLWRTHPIGKAPLSHVHSLDVTTLLVIPALHFGSIADLQNIVLLRGLQAAVAVVFITLALFFASGMHEEKIRYAHA